MKCKKVRLLYLERRLKVYYIYALRWRKVKLRPLGISTISRSIVDNRLGVFSSVRRKRAESATSPWNLTTNHIPSSFIIHSCVAALARSFLIGFPIVWVARVSVSSHWLNWLTWLICGASLCHTELKYSQNISWLPKFGVEYTPDWNTHRTSRGCRSLCYYGLECTEYIPWSPEGASQLPFLAISSCVAVH